MTNLTTIQKLMSEGWTIQVSEAAHEGQPFVAVDEDAGIKHMVFHPMDYTYAAYSDWQGAHELNMLRIYQKIDDMGEIALQKLDMMVDTMNAKHDPKVMAFKPGTVITENEDGSYSFDVLMKSGFVSRQEFMSRLGFPDDDDVSYDELKEKLGREPNFDELVKGY